MSVPSYVKETIGPFVSYLDIKEMTALDGSKLTFVNYSRDSRGEPLNDNVKMVRGWVFDEQGKMILKGFPYTPSNDESALEDPHYEFLPDGALIRVFTYQGKVYYSTNRTLFADRSRFGNSKNFQELFFEICGTTREDFESKILSYPDKIFVYVINHSSLHIFNQLPCTNFVYQVGTYSLVNNEMVRESICEEINDIEKIRSFSGIVGPFSLSKDVATTLLDGWEGIRSPVLLVDSKGYQAVRICPEEVSCRMEIIASQPNFELRCCEMVGESIHPQYMFLPDTLENRLMTLIESVHSSRQEEVRETVIKFLKDRTNLIEKLSEIRKEGKLQKYIDELEAKKAECEFANQVKVYEGIIKRLKAIEDYSVSHAVSFKQVLQRENGFSLHRIIKFLL